MASEAGLSRRPLSLRILGACLGAAGYVGVAIAFHPVAGDEATGATLLYAGVAWLMALMLAGLLLGPVGGGIFGFLLGLAQWPIEAVAGDGQGVAGSVLVISAFVGVAAGALSGGFADMFRKGQARAAQLAAQHAELAATTERLARSDRLFRQFADRVDVGMWIAPVSPPGPPFANAAANRLYGAEGPVADWRENIHPEDRERVLTTVAELGARDEIQVEYRLLTLDGKMRWVRARSFVVHDEAGNVALTSGLLYDITEEKEKEANRELIERRERLASLGTLMAGVAHEVNNPLTYLMGNMQLARKELERAHAGASEPRIERAAKLLSTSVDGGERIAKIVKALKAVTRTSSVGGRAPFGLNSVAANVHALMSTSVPATLNLRLVTSPADPVVLGDSGEIAQVMLNLATNAVQALGDKPGSVILEARRSGTWAELVVRDDGPGLSPEARARLFTPFFTTKPEGTGLGLSLAHTIVREHGGEIEVESEPGRGATFRVRLPLAQSLTPVIP